MKHKNILTIGLMAFALLLVVGCGKTPDPEVTDPTPDPKEDVTTVELIPQPATEPTVEQNPTKTESITKKDPIPTPAKEETKTEPVKDEPKAEEPKKEEPKKEEPKPTPKPMVVSSPAFAYGAIIPNEYTCKGTNVNPQINIGNLPSGTKSVAMIMDDPDAPAGTWDHWLLWNMSASITSIAKNSVPTGAKQGANSWGNSKYQGPCPPSGTHRYMFKVYALDTTLSLPSADSIDLMSAMKGHILKTVTLMGKFSK